MKTSKRPAPKSKPVKSPPANKLHPRTAQRWRKAGTNPDDPAQVRDRLLDAKNVPEKSAGESKRDPSAIPPPDTSGLSGPAGICERLESDVRHLRQRLKAATGDVVLERAIRRQLLAAESELRKFYDSNPDSGTGGTVIPRAEAERLASALGYSLRLALHQTLPGGDERDLAMLRAFAGFASNCCDAMRCPEWAVAALRRGFLDHGFDDKVLDEWFSKLARV